MSDADESNQNESGQSGKSARRAFKRKAEPAPATATAPDPDAGFGPLGQPLNRRSPFVVGFFAAAGALVAWFVFGLISGLGSVFVQVLVSFFLAAGLSPAVEWLMSKGLRRPWALLVITLTVIVAILIFVFALVPVITDQIDALSKSIPGWINQLEQNERLQKLNEQYHIITKLEKYITDGQLTRQVFGGALGVGLKILGFFANAFVVTVMTLYFLAMLPKVKETLWRFTPASRRQRVQLLGDRIFDGIGGYVSGAFIVASCAGASTFVVLFIVGLGKYALALSLVVAVLDIIPMIGATLGAIVVCLIGAATDLQTGVILVIFYIAYQQFENYVIYPRVMSRAVDLPGLLTVIAALIGASLLGVVGALLAIPCAAAVVLLTKEVVFRRQDSQ